MHYKVSTSEYYRGINEDDDYPFFYDSPANVCRVQINQLIDRYGLAGKKVLSLASGKAFEEYWLSKAECELTLVDLDSDSDGALQKRLSKIIPSVSDIDSINFFITDCIEYCASFKSPEFDILYVSGMAPDELRREQIQTEFIANRTEAARLAYLTWPKGTTPYSKYISAGWALVKDGGLAIMQHYRGGVDVLMQPHYLADMRDQLKEHDMFLLEVWCFRKSPQHLLVVAVKGNHNLEKWSLDLINKPLITSFHRRYFDSSINTDIIRVYPLPDNVNQTAKLITFFYHFWLILMNRKSS